MDVSPKGVIAMHGSMHEHDNNEKDITKYPQRSEQSIRRRKVDYRIHDIDHAHFMAILYDDAYNFYKRCEQKGHSRKRKLFASSSSDSASTDENPIINYIIEPLNEKIWLQEQLFMDDEEGSYEDWIRELELGVEGEYTVLPDFLYNYGKFLVENDNPQGIYYLAQYLEHTSEYEYYREKVLQNFMYDEQELEAYIMPNGTIYDWNAMIDYKDFIVEQLMDVEECVLQGRGIASTLPNYKLPVPLELEQVFYPYVDEKEALERYQYIDYMYVYECYSREANSTRLYEIIIPAWAIDSYTTYFEPEIEKRKLHYLPVKRSEVWRLEALQYKANLAIQIQKPDAHYHLGTVAFVKLYEEDVNEFIELVRKYVKLHISEHVTGAATNSETSAEKLEAEYAAIIEGKQFAKWHESIQLYIRAAMLAYSNRREQNVLVNETFFEITHRKLYEEYVHTYLASCFPHLFKE